jgi:hypothetical protein
METRGRRDVRDTAPAAGCVDRQRAGEHDDDGQHPREDGAVDEKLGHGVNARLLSAALAMRPPAAATVGRAAAPPARWQAPSLALVALAGGTMPSPCRPHARAASLRPARGRRPSGREHLPAVADGAADHDGALGHLVVRADHQGRWRCRRARASRPAAARAARPRSRLPAARRARTCRASAGLGVGHDGAQRDAAGAGVDRDAAEGQLAGCG